LVKVIVGVRRCGKSTLLDLYRDDLLQDGVGEASVLSLNFESLELADTNSPQALGALVTAHQFPSGKRYIFLDEVQLVPGWQQAVNSLRLDERNDIYVTGSNARLLDSQLATLLSGRYVTIEVFPLSFAEYVNFVPAGPSLATLFNDYLRRGGLPGQFDLPDDQRVQTQYIDAVLNTIITKDIIAQREVRDVDALLKIVRYLSANVGRQVTAKGVADYLTSSGRRVTPDTVDNYLGLLEDAYLFYRAKREDLRGKATMKTNDKFYTVDLGFRTVTQGLGSWDLGAALENVVYFELRRRFHKVSVGKYGAEEIDFVCFTPNDGLAYFQVTASMLDPTTAERELGPLQALTDSYPKTILTLDEVLTPDVDGIKVVNLVEWLLARSHTQGTGAQGRT